MEKCSGNTSTNEGQGNGTTSTTPSDRDAVTTDSSSSVKHDHIVDGKTVKSEIEQPVITVKSLVLRNASDVVVSSDDEVEIVNIISAESKKKIIGPPIEIRSDGEEKLVKDEIKVRACPSQESGTTSDDDAPQDQCSICLCEFDNKSFLDQCFHAFCFYCILQWSEVVRRCPLCKATFFSIIHSVKSMVEFEQHHLPEPAETSLPTDANQEGRRFLYRTTLVDGRPPLQRRARPPALDAWQRREQQRQLYQSRQRQKAVMAKEKRRTVYANNLWVQHVPQRGKPKFRDISAEFLRANPACIHRLVPWLSRELHVLLDDDQSTVELVMPLITRLITRVEIQSDEFAEQLQQFLFDKSYHFAHEFASFARSPFDMSTYDDRAEYNKPKNPTSVDPGTPVVFQSSSTGWDSPDTASPLAVLPASDTTCLSGFTSLPGPSGVTAFSQPSRWDDGQTNRHLSNNWSPPSEANPYIPTIHIRDESTSPESVRMQEVSPSTETSRRTVSGHSAKEDRTSKKRKKPRKHKRKHSKHKTEKQSIENGRPTHNQPGGSLNSCSRSRTKSRSRSRIRSRSPARSRSRSHTRSHSRLRTSSRSRSRTSSRSRSRIRSRSRSQELDSRTLRSGKSFERRSRASHRESRSRSKSRTKRERSRKKSRSRSRPRSRSRSREDSLTGSHSTSLSDRSHKTAGASRSRQVEPNSKEDRSLPAPASPTEAEMKQEIAELEIRIAADRKRLLELLQKQKERKTEEAQENVDGCGGEETCDKNILYALSDS